MSHNHEFITEEEIAAKISRHNHRVPVTKGPLDHPFAYNVTISVATLGLDKDTIVERLADVRNHIAEGEHPLSIGIVGLHRTPATTPNPWSRIERPDDGILEFYVYHLMLSIRTIEKGSVVLARLKPGPVSVDMQQMRWPELRPSVWGLRKVNPDLEFVCVFDGGYWDCHAPGFGLLGRCKVGDVTGPSYYGSGSVFLYSQSQLDIIRELPKGTNPHTYEYNHDLTVPEGYDPTQRRC